MQVPANRKVLPMMRMAGMPTRSISSLALNIRSSGPGMIMKASSPRKM